MKVLNIKDWVAVSILLWDVWNYRNSLKHSGASPKGNVLMNMFALHVEKFRGEDVVVYEQ